MAVGKWRKCWALCLCTLVRYAMLSAGAEQYRVPCHSIRPPSNAPTPVQKKRSRPLLLTAPATKSELSPLPCSPYLFLHILLKQEPVGWEGGGGRIKHAFVTTACSEGGNYIGSDSRLLTIDIIVGVQKNPARRSRLEPWGLASYDCIRWKCWH